MMRLQPVFCAVLCLFLFSTCVRFPSGLRSNQFEQRFPVARCGGKVQVKDPDPNVALGQYINPSTGIWLLTPYLKLKPPKFTKSQEDFDYINRMHDFLISRIEDKFEREKWVVEIKPYDIELIEEERKDQVINYMVSNAVQLDTINYGNWNVPPELIRSDVPGYSLFMFIDGQVGFDRVTGYQNVLYLFLIDNQSRKTTYADYMRYECDVRNINGLDKILDYAYLKLITLRFPNYKPEGE